MEERLREMEYAFKNMDQCMEQMNSDYRSTWKDSKCFNSCNSYNSYNDWDRRSNEAEFHQTLKNGEFFEKWHYQDQRVWRLEHFCMEMAKRMNFMEMETQMQSAMNNHNSMLSTGGSWMNSNSRGMGNDFMSSKMGNCGNNYGSWGNCNSYNMPNDMNNKNNWSIAPPSGGRRNPSRPAFANRYNNRFGNCSNGMRGSKFGAAYDDGFSGMSNRFDNFGNNSRSMYGSKFGGAMYDDGFSGMSSSKYGGMSNGGMSNMHGSNMGFASPCRGRMY